MGGEDSAHRSPPPPALADTVRSRDRTTASGGSASLEALLVPMVNRRPRAKIPGRESQDAVRVWNPEGFDPENYLSEDVRRYGDCARYLLHRIHWAAVFDRRLRGEYVPLKAAYMRQFFPRDDVYKRVRDCLIGREAVICDNSYTKGKKSYGYRLGPELSRMRQHGVTIADRRLADKIRRNRAEWLNAPAGVHRHLLAWLRCVQIDYPAALGALLGDDHFEPVDETAIQAIRDRQFFFHVCDYGRVHTNLTNLKSSMREFLRYRGMPLVNLDIKNAQPLLFSILLRERYAASGMPSDVRRYIDLCQAGKFYDAMMAEAGIPEWRRGEFKRKFFAHVFFCKNRPVTDTARAFGGQFPNVYAVVQEAKAEDYTALSKELQRRESGLMIGRVAARCMDESPRTFVATIHDSILTTPDRAGEIRSLMLEEFARIDLHPTINAEHLGKIGKVEVSDNCKKVAS